MLEKSVMSEMTIASARMRSSRFVRRSLPTGHGSSNRSLRSTDNPKFDVPTVDTRTRYDSMYIRHPEDRQYIQPYDWSDDKPRKSKIPLIIHAQPSYTNFRVPFPMVCKERYNNSIKKYEKQFGHEIRSQIDNQPTAREATYLYCGLYYFMAAISQ
ncbi:uncharacterized protein LOC135435217 isoform X2 [Drosophila montana]|uniref:uncharacterized protein LOC135435217 isoform X2 n=1 Tax=Drosophila montana TaxID=40370 RepID=UPI00313ED220